ncbi:MAG: response regulator transcription factor [Flavobacteriales bacterium]|jgi:two-component system LytT family response regulator|nr:response regulator transcription factor [Flavobacteriales bacterium]
MSGPLRAVIVDDDAFSRAQVEVELRRHNGTVAVVGHGASGADGIDLITGLGPDLVLLDVQMPDMDGFAMLDALPKRDFAVIFITGFEAYAIRAIRYSALDYLLKPIKPAELDAAIAHVIAQRDLLPARVDRLLLDRPSHERAPDTLVIVTRKGDRHLRTTDIIRCEADRNYTWFHLCRGERLLSSYPLSTYEEFLAEKEFLRAHRSHIINLRHVRSFTSEGLVTMSDGGVIEVSRRRKAEVLEQLRNASEHC